MSHSVLCEYSTFRQFLNKYFWKPLVMIIYNIALSYVCNLTFNDLEIANYCQEDEKYIKYQ